MPIASKKTTPTNLVSGSTVPTLSSYAHSSSTMAVLAGAVLLRETVGLKKNSALHGPVMALTKNSSLKDPAIESTMNSALKDPAIESTKNSALGSGYGRDDGMVGGVKGVVQGEETESGDLGEGGAVATLGMGAADLVDHKEGHVHAGLAAGCSAAHVLGGQPMVTSGFVLAQTHAGHVGASLVRPCKLSCMAPFDVQGSVGHVTTKLAVEHVLPCVDHVLPSADHVLPCMAFERAHPVQCEGKSEEEAAASFIFSAHVGASTNGVSPPSMAAMEVDRKHFKWKRVARRGMVGSGDDIQMPCLGKRVESEPLEGGGCGESVKQSRGSDNGESSLNSKFFHAKASARRKFNEILGLSDEQGCWHSDLGSIHRIVGEYFSSIFSSSAPSPEALRRVTQVMEPRVSPAMNELLDAKFSAEEDRWLPRPSSFKVIAGCSLTGDSVVAALKSASGAWSSSLIRSSFAPIDVECILSLPTSVRPCPDQLLWHLSKDGKYSVKSGLNIPAKVRMFVWRACRNLLPTRSLLAARRVPVGAGCPLCDAAVDSVLHSLWSCRSLVDSKAVVPFLASLRLSTVGSFFDFVLAYKVSLLVHEMELLLVLFWRFWFRRNRAVHSAPLLSVEETVGWSELYLADFQAAAATPRLRGSSIVERWQAPSPGWVKINSDVAVDVRGHRLGFGVVFRDSVGKVLVSYTSLLLGLFSPDIGEALAILLGLRLAIDMGLSTICVKSDAASVVKQLSSRVTSCSDIGLVLDDILSLVVGFADISFSSVRRSANQVAHGLAKFALTHQSVGVRLGGIPSPVALVVMDDSRGCP
ncbi:hypothetical protein JRO89_XS06G0225100 [Xanthoceras sorbifolium]|uniref:RNase H type-1 domain-containing protein n=1 Tax=Xanthoceras sorbifolium TaxID=99658 RepID=A0ABQ8HZ79_9ROSI|nr:hypothetical protein JRO89_XS06G0225100 [Xanthoceras sorbifolium]